MQDFKIQIPDKYYDMELIDIQVYDMSKICYIFIDENDEVDYYFYNGDVLFYYYKYNGDFNKAPLIAKKEDLQIQYVNDIDGLKHLNKIKNTRGYYYADLPVAIRHSLDYYSIKEQRNNKNHISKQPKIMYYDIEVFTNNAGSFPTPEQALYPINAITISFNYRPDTITYLYIDSKHIKHPEQLDEITNDLVLQYENMEENIKFNENLFIFYSETEMITRFWADVHTKYKPIILTGWNSNNFDFQYIYNRMKNLKLNTNMMSKFNKVSIDPLTGYDGDPLSIGYIIIDMLKLYKSLTQNKKEKYSLSFISRIELHDDKIEYSGNLDTLYQEDLIKFLKYNRQDVHLVKRLDKKVGHISLQTELLKITRSTWKYNTTSRLVDTYIIYELYKMGLYGSVPFSKLPRRSDAKGAYVSTPVHPGLNEWVGDFDATSLYPSIMRTMNIGPNTFIYKIKESDAFEFIYNRGKFKDDDLIAIETDPIYQAKFRNKITARQLQELLDANYIMTLNGCIFLPHSKEKSIYYDILNTLFDSRKYYKKEMYVYLNDDNIAMYDQYNNKQKSYKVVMNSIYGVMGSSFFRYSIQDLLEAVTITGREIIKNTDLFADNLIKQWINEPYDADTFRLTYEQFYEDDVKTKYVIYTDTDSCMVTLKPVLDMKQIYARDFETKKEYHETVIPILQEKMGDLQGHVNDELMIDIVKMHGGSLDHNYLSFKNEWFADKVWFQTNKKKYAIHMIFQEGNVVDKIDAKGIDIERSDYPNITKQKLKHLLNLILIEDEFNYDTIMKFVTDTEKEIKQIIINGDTKIGKPVSWSKQLTDYKTVPTQINGMMTWNNIEYQYFNHGIKGYLFYIKGIDMFRYNKSNINAVKEFNKLPPNKRNNIVIPSDEERVPPYYIIDVDKMLMFAWNDRWTLLLEPILATKRSATKKENRLNSRKKSAIGLF